MTSQSRHTWGCWYFFGISGISTFLVSVVRGANPWYPFIGVRCFITNSRGSPPPWLITNVTKNTLLRLGLSVNKSLNKDEENYLDLRSEKRCNIYFDKICFEYYAAAFSKQIVPRRDLHHIQSQTQKEQCPFCVWDYSSVLHNARKELNIADAGYPRERNNQIGEIPNTN